MHLVQKAYNLYNSTPSHALLSLVLEVNPPHAYDIILVGRVVERAVERAVVACGEAGKEGVGLLACLFVFTVSFSAGIMLTQTTQG